MVMSLGVALPHYDLSVPGRRIADPDDLARAAADAESLGFSHGWVSDHFTLPLDRYRMGTGDTGSLEAWTALGIAAAATSTMRIGTLVLCEAFRPAGLLAKMAATLDRSSGGRLDLGLGAGWHEPDYRMLGMVMPSPGVRVQRLEEYARVVRALLSGSPVTFEGEHHTVRDAWVSPGPVQSPHPPIWIGGSKDRLLGVVGRVADGWNICWRVPDHVLRDRMDALDRACVAAGRRPGDVTRSVGLYCIIGKDDADVARQLDDIEQSLPPGSTWRREDFVRDVLVGTAAQVRDRLDTLAAAGIAQVIVTPGPMAFRWPAGWAETVAEHLIG